MKIYIELTGHCIDQIKKRNPDYSNDKDASKFGKYMFKKFINRGKHEGRDVRYSYTKDGKYKITDGIHQFIYAKPYKIEYILITYVKRKIELGKILHPKERLINGEIK